jgi:hypothetical protein
MRLNAAMNRLSAGLLLTAGLYTTPTHAAPLSFAAKDLPAGQATLEIHAEQLVTMTALPFRLILKDAAGGPVTGARVECELTMPSMRMPENRPKVVERDGAYVGEMILTCTMGDYRATCVAEETTGARRTSTFDLGTARMK